MICYDTAKSGVKTQACPCGSFVDKVTPGQIFLGVLQFSLATIIPQKCTLVQSSDICVTLFKQTTCVAKEHIIKVYSVCVCVYRGADRSLARPGRKQATGTEDFEFHISYF
jgi:hypothetical protein